MLPSFDNVDCLFPLIKTTKNDIENKLATKGKLFHSFNQPSIH